MKKRVALFSLYEGKGMEHVSAAQQNASAGENRSHYEITGGVKQHQRHIGRRKKADYIKDMIKSFPYFQENPSHVWEQAIPEDPYGRKNIFAFIEGNGESLNTVIYHAHLDTVGIEDFGPLKDIALIPTVSRNISQTMNLIGMCSGMPAQASGCSEGVRLICRAVLPFISPICFTFLNGAISCRAIFCSWQTRMKKASIPAF